jgi:uncharacterized protein
MPEMSLLGVRLEPDTGEPTLVLRETHGERCLPIGIGAAEAAAITAAGRGRRPGLPLTHDLLADVVAALGRRVERVCVTGLLDSIFFAELVFDGGTRVSARPSDAVALALRNGAPVHVAEPVLAEAGTVLPGHRPAETAEQDAVRRFRSFLDSVSPEDFGGEAAR